MASERGSEAVAELMIALTLARRAAARAAEATRGEVAVWAERVAGELSVLELQAIRRSALADLEERGGAATHSTDRIESDGG